MTATRPEVAPARTPGPSPARGGGRAYAPLARPLFRNLWIAGVVSTTGTWVHEVGAGWLMTELRPSPLMVSLVATATTLPMLLLSIPAGALADVLDRRRIMLATQIVKLALAGLLAVMLLGGVASPWLLLVVALGLGAAAAVLNPAWQTTMTELVPREELPAASALNSVSMNLSRALGPALGGLIVAQAGPAAAFGLNALSVLGMLAVLSTWRSVKPDRGAPGERFVGALKAGVRYVRHHPPMHAVLVRTLSFVVGASSIWALMPLVAREQLGMGATGYGFMLGGLGAGAVLATVAIPFLRSRFRSNQLIVASTLLYAGALVALAQARRPELGLPLMLAVGTGWVVMVVTLNVAAQSGTPPWVRGRALAAYFTAFFGSMAAGSVLWGVVAGRVGLDGALGAAAGVLVFGLLTLPRFALAEPTAEDLARSASWEDPVVSHQVDPDDGPVVVTIEYRIAPADAGAFHAAMQPVRRTRHRDGAIFWILSRDTEQPERWLEVFVVESWAEHLRQHARVTVADTRVQEAARAFHAGPGRPVVSHLIAGGAGRGAAIATAGHGAADANGLGSHPGSLQR